MACCSRQKTGLQVDHFWSKGMTGGTALPVHLKERCIHRHGPVPETPVFVLHWMRTAIRLDENPTFDVARTLADNLGLPLLVYHGIDERYPHASYRLHRFLLEGATDVAARAETIGVDHLVHVAREGHRSPALLDLAAQAAVVVTDMADLEPWRTWAKHVTSIRRLIEVDAHCVLPRPVFGRSLDRPFRFRDATKKDMQRRAGLPWPTCDAPIQRLPEGWTPPFSPVDVRSELASDGGRSLLSACAIDATVMPVTDLHGGSGTGLSHWTAWCEDGLSRYHRRRNDAAERSGVSGMSPWLHFGMVAATRVVRDAVERGGKGAEKFLDEMLVFREHAQHHVHAVERADGWEHLPAWARASWHRSTLTGPTRSALDLERGRAMDALWDAAQRGLVRHGVMHNNVRMTWGKGVPQWIEDPEAAMHLALALNDRYALDGRDASSIAGVQWCFGLFDRPFDPPELRMGRVRRRPTTDHTRRIDLARYQAWTEAPSLGRELDVGVVGGGLAGRFAARLLQDLGHRVTVWDKGGRASGRLADRRGEEGASFPMGAPRLDGLPAWSGRYVEDWVERGLVLRDGPTSVVPAQGLPALLDHLGEDLDVRLRTRITSIEADEDGAWVSGRTGDDEVHVHHDLVLLAVPLEQARDLVPALNLEGQSEASLVAWGPEAEVLPTAPPGWDIALEAGRTVARLNHEASQPWLDVDLQDLAALVAERLGMDPEGWSAHRWRFSRPVKGPTKVLHHGHVTLIGDAFGTPVGTGGAALDSAARAVADLHLRPWRPEAAPAQARQTDLAAWGA